MRGIRKDRPEHETSLEGACFPIGGKEAESEENPQAKRAMDGERAVPERGGAHERAAILAAASVIEICGPEARCS
jgi:hypothetical protein